MKGVKLAIGLLLVMALIDPSGAFAAADPQASETAKNVLAYLSNLPTGGINRVISGQFSQDMSEINGVYNATGEYPGVLGVDLQWDRPSDSTIINYFNAGGLITVTQHWDNPSTGGNAWDTACDLNQVVTEGTQANTRFKGYLDGTAAFLQILSDAGVVVLFRPLHEMNWPWFWWGGKPAQAYQNLWFYTFHYLTGTKGLHNLLWVYSPGESINISYYPGPQYVDIIGVSLYGHGTNVPRVNGYNQLPSLDKPFAITEWGMCAGGLTWTPGQCPPRDMTPFLSSLKANMPDATYWLAWDGVYAMSYNYGVANVLNDPWVVTRDEMDVSWRLGGGGGTPLPDLIVQSVVVNPWVPVSGQPVEVTVTVKNQGNADSAAFETDFYQNLTSAPAVQQEGDGRCSKSSLAAGATDSCTFTATFSTTGSYQMWAQVDTDHAVPETEETNNVTGPQAITVISQDSELFSDDFSREQVADPLWPWIVATGAWTITDGVAQGSSSPSAHASMYVYDTPPWTDYSVEGLVQFPAGAFGGGLGGRVDPASGTRYGAWVYPAGSFGGSNLLKLVKFFDWTSWSGVPMKQVSVPDVGTGWHTIKMTFTENRIQVSYDGTLMIDMADNNFDSRAPYSSGGISLDMWTYTSPYVMKVDNILVTKSEETPQNTPPTAGNDLFATPSGSALNVAAPGVLSNDSDPEGATLAASMVSGPAHGLLSLHADGSFTYTPDAGYVGTDSFTYTASDGINSSNVATVSLSVQAQTATLLSVTLTPSTVTGGSPCQGTVTLSGSAPSGGALVYLLSTNTSVANVPKSVMVTNGSSEATFTVTTNSVSTSTSLSISATYSGVSKSAVLGVTSASLVVASLSISPSAVVGGQTSTGTVTLSGAAPRLGAAVSLLSSNGSVANVPASVTVPRRTTSTTFTVSTSSVSASTSVTLSASYNGVTQASTLTVDPSIVSLSTLTMSPGSVVGGNTITGTVTLDGAAPLGGIVVWLSSSDSSSASVPDSVTVQGGGTNASFTAATAAVSTSTNVTLSATYNGITKSAQISLNPPASLALASLSLSPSTVRGGNTVSGKVTLTGVAPSGGVAVSLSSSSTSVASVPASVTVGSGSTSATFAITTRRPFRSRWITITATYMGIQNAARLYVTR